MTPQEIEKLIPHWTELELDEAEDYRAVCGPVSDEQREGIWHVVPNQFEDASAALLSCDYRKIERKRTNW